ncbi:MAG: Rho termination factor N-terminal domain-containing protein [Eggerthellaceae bacterium]|nr:Rho termination factor N-terminal domain-containing protein [Eggerthellaceae bacterium]
MTKDELLAYAAELGIEGVSSSMTKAEIIQAIEGMEGGE